MNGEIICVGTELLLGSIVNTNAQYLSKELAALGINLYSQATVGDNALRLKKALATAVSRSEVILITGGLGPTEDDLTKETVSAAVSIPLVNDEESLKRIEDFFKDSGRKMTDNNKKQALKPKGSIVFPNDHGTAPGYAIHSGKQCIIMLPGPPDELVPMFHKYVKPFLSRVTNSVIVSRDVRIFGLGESMIAEIAGDLLNGTNPTVATYAGNGEVQLRVTASAVNSDEADSICQPAIDKLKALFGDLIYGIDKDSLEQVVVEQLKGHHMKISTAESCTAGLLSKRITDVPGSSSVFEMGITAYSKEIKTNALGVDPELLMREGAVSPNVAAAMAVGVRDISGADLSISITGVAGPESSDNQPVGLVYIALTDGRYVWVGKILSGAVRKDRDKIRILAVSAALNLVRRYMNVPAGALEGARQVGSEFKDSHVIPLFGASLAAGGILGETAAGRGENLSADEPDRESINAADNAEPAGNLLAADEAAADDLLSDPPAAGDGAVKMSADTRLQSAEVGNEITPDFTDDYIISAGDEPVDDGADDSADDSEKEADSIAKKKEPLVKRFFKYLLPWKGDTIAEVIRKCIFLVAFIGLIVSGTIVANYYLADLSARNDIDKVRGIYDTSNDEIGPDGIYKRFNGLLAINKDVVGWINIQGTQVDNPVFKAADNDYYLHRDMYRQDSKNGSLFLDSRTTFERYKVSQNQVIYGHHMKTGTMFGSLKNYKKLEYYKENPIIQYDTLYNKGTYKIFSVFLVNTIASQDSGYVFNYREPDYASPDDFLNFIADIKNRSLFDIPVDVAGDDEIITLSTCSYEFDEFRMVVVARRVRTGETSTVNVSDAVKNPDPLYPQIWYTKNGGKKPAEPSKIPTSNNSTSSTKVSGTASSPAASSNSGVASSKAATSSKAAVSSKAASSAKPASSAPPVSTAPASSAVPSSAPSASAVSSVPSASVPDTSKEPAAGE